MLDASRTHDPTEGARVGPNAILQLTDPVEQALGTGTMDSLLACCGVDMPSGQQMIAEDNVAKVHQALHRFYPEDAHSIARAAGLGTAQYIRANRIPTAARMLLRVLPSNLGAFLLTRAISAHAWTFCGSGTLTAQAGRIVVFSIKDNPLLAVPHADQPQCEWHAAVFEELFTSLLGRTYKAVETQCCAQGAAACTFEVSRV